MREGKNVNIGNRCLIVIEELKFKVYRKEECRWIGIRKVMDRSLN